MALKDNDKKLHTHTRKYKRAKSSYINVGPIIIGIVLVSRNNHCHSVHRHTGPPPLPLQN